MHIAPIATACATAVLLACNVPPAPELPPLIAPADLLPEDEPVYMHAQFDKFKMAWFADFDRRYVDTYQVEFEYSRLSVHIQRWHEEVGHPKRWTDAEMQNAQYARTPEAEHYRGARKRAVAIGLLAMSLWWRNPGVGRPTAADMDKCVPLFTTRGCPLDGRTLSLERMVRMAMGADPALFRVQLRKARALEEAQRAR